MTHDRRPTTDLESALRGHYRRQDPGGAPLALRRLVEEVPGTFDRVPQFAFRDLLAPALGLTAVLAILAIGLRLLPLARPGSGVGPDASAGPTTVFDPGLTGIGLGPADSAAGHWLLVGVAALALVGLAAVLRGRRALLPLAGAAGAVGYAIFATFVPIDLHVTGWGPGLSVVGVPLPVGAEGSLYYQTAKPGEPYAFGVLLNGGDEQAVRIEGLVDDWWEASAYEGLHWTAVWLDREPHGGMMGPARPFAPFDMPRDGQAIWLVGRASSCALGRAPLEREALGSIWIAAKVNVTVYGWPRVVELELPRIVEPQSEPCTTRGTPE